MLFSTIGNYALLLGLFFGLVLFYFSARNFRNSKVLDAKILSFTFLQFFLVVFGFFALFYYFLDSVFVTELVLIIRPQPKPFFIKFLGTGEIQEETYL